MAGAVAQQQVPLLPPFHAHMLVIMRGICCLALAAAAYPCSPSHLADCPTAPGGLSLKQVPQFITITWDDAVDSVSSVQGKGPALYVSCVSVLAR